MNILIQLVGLVAAGCVLWSFQQNKRSHILLLLIAGQILFCVHFYLLDAWTAVAINLIGIVRGVIFNLKAERRWAQYSIWVYLFIVLFWISGYFTWEGPRSLLPLLAMTIETVGLWRRDPKAIRWFLLIIRPLFFTYAFLVGSYAGMLADILFSVSIMVSMFRFDRKPKKALG